MKIDEENLTFFVGWFFLSSSASSFRNETSATTVVVPAVLLKWLLCVCVCVCVCVCFNIYFFLLRFVSTPTADLRRWRRANELESAAKENRPTGRR